MVFEELFMFENPGVVALAAGVLVFVVLFSVLSKKFDKGASILISLVFGFLSGYYLYKNWLYDYSGDNKTLLAIVLIVLVAVIIIKIFLAFTRGIRYRFRR